MTATWLCGLLLLFGFGADAGGTRTYRGAPEPLFSVIIMPRADLYEEAVKCGFNLVTGASGTFVPGDPRLDSDEFKRMFATEREAEQYAKVLGLHFGLRQSGFNAKRLGWLLKRSECRDWSGKVRFPCPSSRLFRETLAKATGWRCAQTPAEHIRLFDELASGCCARHFRDFTSYLERSGYHPWDFDERWRSWSDVRPPEPPEKSDGHKRLSYLFRLWREEQFLLVLKQSAAAAKRARPKILVNLGIFSPLNLYWGYHRSTPLVQLCDIAEADYVEFDWYDSIVCGGKFTPETFALQEAVCEWTADVTGMPLVVTLNARLGRREPDYFRLLTLATMLLCDRVIGVDYYYYGAPIVGTRERFALGSPRMKAVSEALVRIRKVYPRLKHFREHHDILILGEDPIWMGAGRFDADGRAVGNPFKDLARANALTYPFLHLAHLGFDADFAIPRSLGRTDLRKYRLVLASCAHISDRDFARLAQFAKSGGRVVRTQSQALAFDEVGIDRTFQRRSVMEQFMPVCEPGTERFREMLGLPRVGRKTPTTVDVDIRRDQEGRTLVVVMNYGLEPARFEVRLRGSFHLEAQWFKTADVSVHKEDNSTTLTGTLPRREVEAFLLSPLR